MFFHLPGCVSSFPSVNGISHHAVLHTNAGLSFLALCHLREFKKWWFCHLSLNADQLSPPQAAWPDLNLHLSSLPAAPHANFPIVGEDIMYPGPQAVKPQIEKLLILFSFIPSIQVQ